MNFLSIDCSTEIGSLFAKVKNKTFLKFLQSDKFITDLLMKQILDFFKENDIKFDDIQNIFVNQGPGNFSGLRASLATVKGISLSKNIKLSGYNSFLWLCTKFFNKEDNIYCLIKFRKNYFVKKYDKNLKSILETKKVTEDQILKEYSNKFKLIPKNISHCFSDNILKLNNLSIIDLNHNELEFLEIKGLLDQNLIKPFYLS